MSTASKAFLGLAVIGVLTVFTLSTVVIAAQEEPQKAEAKHQAAPATPEKASTPAAENLKKIHKAVKDFSAANKGRWPGHGKEPGGLMFPMKGIYPQYLTDPRLLVDPANAKIAGKLDKLPVSESTLPEFWYNGSFFYLGYAVTNDKEGMALVNALKGLTQEGKEPSGDLKVAKGEGNAGGDTIYGLREGIGRFFIRDINNPAATAVSDAQIPVMIERPVDGGGQVLFMDGHVQYVKYPGQFPMTPDFIQGLISLDELLRTKAPAAAPAK